MSEQTLYEKVGGGEAIEKVVDYFYEELVLKDPKSINSSSTPIWSNRNAINLSSSAMHWEGLINTQAIQWQKHTKA
ncbi:hypothetical protein GCM10009865_14270 [Aeromicrobium ponti]|uniref:Globin n=1 Tax=Cytobacillus oceanisediminis TaxID=665099 RepID=A0A562K3Q3_9BACI|nr:globin [Cytobacillus oceanisediminis]